MLYFFDVEACGGHLASRAWDESNKRKLAKLAKLQALQGGVLAEGAGDEDGDDDNDDDDVDEEDEEERGSDSGKHNSYSRCTRCCTF